MVHFSCDKCGKDLTAANSQRYVARICVYPPHNHDQITDDDLDHMEAVAEILQREGYSPEANEPPRFVGFRYDLCADCHHQFIQDPLNRDPIPALNYSKN